MVLARGSEYGWKMASVIVVVVVLMQGDAEQAAVRRTAKRPRLAL